MGKFFIMISLMIVLLVIRGHSFKSMFKFFDGDLIALEWISLENKIMYGL